MVVFTLHFTFDVNCCGELVFVCVTLHCSGANMKQSRYLPSCLQHSKSILISEVEEDLDSHLPAKIRKLKQDEEVCVVGYFESFAVCLSSHCITS